jgi:transcription termination factor Rho
LVSDGASEAGGVFHTSGKSGGMLRANGAYDRARGDDVSVPPRLCRDLGLRGGELVEGTLRPGRTRPELATATAIDGQTVADHLRVVPFERLTAIQPNRPLRLETEGGPIATRLIDLLVPVGFGQRGLIVAPPRSGKTIILKQIAAGAAANHPDLHVIVLLVDERPEEVTDIRRNIPGEVLASSNDREAESHLALGRLAIERAKRLAERGRDVLLLIDSLTRLGRASNSVTRGRGRTLSGGLDQDALIGPKSIFGAARNLEEAGSITTMATILVGTESRMDDIIFSEFKGSGNLELVLSRDLAEQRIWPALDLGLSGTREEERLLTPAALRANHYLRRSLQRVDKTRVTPRLLELFREFPHNDALVAGLGGR